MCFSLQSYSQQASDINSKPVYEFIENQGQWHPLAKYKAKIPYGTIYLEGAGFVYDLIDPTDYQMVAFGKPVKGIEVDK